MSEEKNDNLLENETTTDGNKINETQNDVQTQDLAIETILEPEVSITLDTTLALSEVLDEPLNEVSEVEINESENSDASETTEVEAIAPETIIELTDKQVHDDTLEIQSSSDSVMDAIDNTNAAESEDETLKSSHDIPQEDYEAMTMEALISSLEKIVVVEKVMSVQEHVEEIKKAFLSKYYHLLDEKKDEFNAENPDSTEEFKYHSPLKVKFDTLYTQYKEKKNNHFKSLQTNLQQNLENRLALVEELKNLIHSPENITSSLKQLNDIRERWKNAGAIPKDKYNHVWNNYHFHIENFYDFLHLDREARDIDFKHNLDLKLKIIARVEELVNESDINKAFRELQDLHKIWKEDIGPVSRENREVIWKRFSYLTKQIHDQREAFYESFRAVETENLEKKNELIAQLVVLSQEKVTSHQAWLNQIVKVEALRDQFFKTGKVPSEVNEATWSSFKNAVKDFNVLKNSFYKDIKKDQNDNLSKKQALIAKANELKESEDFEGTTQMMKQIQEEWKLIGHVPRKFSDELWTEFRSACNNYFERLKNSKKEEDSEEVASFEKKKEYLEVLKSFELIGEHKPDLDAIKLHIETWKSLGRVPFNRRHIEGKFNKILDALFEKLSLSKRDTEKMRFANKLDNLSDNSKKLDGEKIFIMRKIDEVQNEIFQLENNIQFFQNTKNAKKENSIVTEVRKTIAKHKEELDTWKDKLKQIRDLAKQELNNL
ncbi:MAG: DUF349 domain-containing protein [Flavobacterium sp.]|nr:DUF349 domain-containing protein [Flavobacterium sp.]